MKTWCAKRRLRRAAWLALALACAAPAAAQTESQCPVTEYAVGGSIVGGEDVPVAGARVSTEWEERAAGIATTRSTSGPDGQFALRIQFNTYSGQTFSGKQKCEAVLEEVQLQVTAEGYQDAERTIPLGDKPANFKIQLKPR